MITVTVVSISIIFFSFYVEQVKRVLYLLCYYKKKNQYLIHDKKNTTHAGNYGSGKKYLYVARLLGTFTLEQIVCAHAVMRHTILCDPMIKHTSNFAM